MSDQSYYDWLQREATERLVTWGQCNRWSAKQEVGYPSRSLDAVFLDGGPGGNRPADDWTPEVYKTNEAVRRLMRENKQHADLLIQHFVRGDNIDRCVRDVLHVRAMKGRVEFNCAVQRVGQFLFEEG